MAARGPNVALFSVSNVIANQATFRQGLQELFHELHGRRVEIGLVENVDENVLRQQFANSSTLITHVFDKGAFGMDEKGVKIRHALIRQRLLKKQENNGHKFSENNVLWFTTHVMDGASIVQIAVPAMNSAGADDVLKQLREYLIRVDDSVNSQVFPSWAEAARANPFHCVSQHQQPTQPPQQPQPQQPIASTPPPPPPPSAPMPTDPIAPAFVSANAHAAHAMGGGFPVNINGNNMGAGVNSGGMPPAQHSPNAAAGQQNTAPAFAGMHQQPPQPNFAPNGQNNGPAFQQYAPPPQDRPNSQQFTGGVGPGGMPNGQGQGVQNNMQGQQQGSFPQPQQQPGSFPQPQQGMNNNMQGQQQGSFPQPQQQHDFPNQNFGPGGMPNGQGQGTNNNMQGQQQQGFAPTNGPFGPGGMPNGQGQQQPGSFPHQQGYNGAGMQNGMNGPHGYNMNNGVPPQQQQQQQPNGQFNQAGMMNAAQFGPNPMPPQPQPSPPPPPPPPVDPYLVLRQNLKGRKAYVILVELSGVLAHVTTQGADYGGDPNLTLIKVTDGNAKNYDVRIRPGVAEFFRLARLGYIAIWTTLPRAVATAVLGALKIDSTRDIAALFTGDDPLPYERINDTEAKQWVVERNGVKDYHFPGLLKRCEVVYNDNSFELKHAAPFPFSLQRQNCVLVSTRGIPNAGQNTLVVPRWTGRPDDSHLYVMYKYLAEMLANAPELGPLGNTVGADILSYIGVKQINPNAEDKLPQAYQSVTEGPCTEQHVNGAMHTMCVSSHFLPAYLATPREVSEFQMERIAEYLNAYFRDVQDGFRLVAPQGIVDNNPLKSQGTRFIQQMFQTGGACASVMGWWKNNEEVNILGKAIPFNRVAGLVLRHDHLRSLKSLAFLIRATNLAAQMASELQYDITVYYCFWADSSTKYFFKPEGTIVRIPAAIVGSTDPIQARNVALKLQRTIPSWDPASPTPTNPAPLQSESQLIMLEIRVPKNIIHGAILADDPRTRMPTEFFITPYSYYTVQRFGYDQANMVMRVQLDAHNDNMGRPEIPCSFWC